MISSDKAGEPTVMEGGFMLKKFIMAAGLAAAFPFHPRLPKQKLMSLSESVSPAATATIITIPFAAAAMVIIHARGILSPIQSSGIVYPAGKRSGSYGIAVIATLLQRTAVAVPIRS